MLKIDITIFVGLRQSKKFNPQLSFAIQTLPVSEIT